MATAAQSRSQNFAIAPYLTTICLWLGTMFISGLLEPIIGYQAVGFLFLAEVLAVGLVAGTRVVLFSMVLSVFAWNFFFIPPRFSLTVERPEDVSLLITFFVIGGASAFFTGRSRAARRELSEGELRSQGLDRLVDLVPPRTDDVTSEARAERLARAIGEIESVLASSTAGLLFSRAGELDFEPRPHSGELLKEIDIEGAKNFASSGQRSRVFEDAKRGINTYYFTVDVARSSSALLIVRTPSHLSKEELRYLKASAAFLSLIAQSNAG